MSELEAALWKPPTSIKRAPDTFEALRAVPLFADLSEKHLQKVVQLVHLRTYQAGEVIFRQGERGAGMFIIRQGAVRIVVRGRQGTEKEIALLERHQFFGEMALLENAPRSASSVAVDRTELIGFFLPDLEALIDRDPRLGSLILLKLAQLMASRLRSTTEAMKAETDRRAQDMHTHSAEQEQERTK